MKVLAKETDAQVVAPPTISHLRENLSPRYPQTGADKQKKMTNEVWMRPPCQGSKLNSAEMSGNTPAQHGRDRKFFI